jgi:hypothetical protein
VLQKQHHHLRSHEHEKNLVFQWFQDQHEKQDVKHKTVNTFRFAIFLPIHISTQYKLECIMLIQVLWNLENRGYIPILL